MSPTIRIDDDVYAWLKAQAQPFEDTPNTVLRRVAGLDHGISTDAPISEENKGAESRNFSRGTGSKGKAANHSRNRHPARLTGRQLNNDWNVGAKHALFHKDGCWYNNLERFPGALFDADGYVVFETEEEYRNCPYLNIGVQTNVTVSPGIAGIPGYVRKRKG